MNKLIRINLNQTISKAQLEHLKEEKKRWFIFSLIFLLFLGYLGWFGFINNRMDNIIENRKSTIQEIIRDTEKLKKEGKINLSKSDIKTLNKLENKRMFWAPKLIALSEITPDRMSITGLEYDHKRLKISAISLFIPGSFSSKSHNKSSSFHSKYLSIKSSIGVLSQ